MTQNEIEVALCKLISESLSDKQYKSEVVFDLSEKIIDTAWKYYFIDLRNYKCKIHSDDIRHIEKEHGDEVYHVCKIYSYLETFKAIERTKTRDKQSGIDMPCLTFTKQLKDKKIKIVKLHIARNKTLSLKTLFEMA